MDNIHIKIIKHVLTFMFVVLPMQLVGYVVVPLVVLFIPKKRETLPKYLRWWDNARGRLSEAYRVAFSKMEPIVFTTFANTFWPNSYKHRLANPLGIWDGLSGDTKYRIETYLKGKIKVHPQGILARIHWLAFRNPVNYLKHVTLGHQVTNEDVGSIRRYESKRMHWLPEMFQAKKQNLMDWDVSDQGAPGVDYIEFLSRHGKIFEFYYIRPYMLFGKPKCVRIRIGWKIGDKSHVEFHEKLGLPLQWAFVISPFKSYNPLAEDDSDDTQ